MRIRRAVAVAALLATAAAGCTSGPEPGPGTTTAADTDTDKLRGFAKCMREHGVDMPDPGPDGRVVIGDEHQDQQQVNAAMQECRALMPNGGEPPKPDAAQLERMRTFARCMREHGVDMADPDPQTGMIRIIPGKGVKPGEDPDLKAAQEACREFAPRIGG